MRLIRISYVKITPESAEMGDFSENGWIDESGIEVAPDEYDIEEYGSDHAAIVAIAAREITYRHGLVEPSSSRFHSRVWYTETDGTTDYRTGEQTYYSFHLHGFTEQEQRDIYLELTKR